jgi:hypothetical protein
VLNTNQSIDESNYVIKEEFKMMNSI